MVIGSTEQVAIWETSAINQLADRRDSDALIAGMRIAHSHWIPFYVFVEIAATQPTERRRDLLSVCRILVGSSGRRLPWSVVDWIRGAICLFEEFGEVDKEEILGYFPELDREISLGNVFDDDLARVQKPESNQGLKSIEAFFSQMKVPYENYCRSRSSRPMTLDGFVAQCLTDDLIQQSIRDFCGKLLGHTVDLQYAGRFAAAFPPIQALIYSYLVAHYCRNQPAKTRTQSSVKRAKPAGNFDLQAAAYLPVCDLFISSDWPQQKVLQEVAERCQTQGQVISFDDYVKRFNIPE